MFFSRPAGHKLVYRGDPDTIDFVKNDFTCDETWRELDLSGKIPINAAAVMADLSITANAAGCGVIFRKKGNVNDINISGLRSSVIDVNIRGIVLLWPNADCIIEYFGDNYTYSVLTLIITNWFL